MPKLRKIPDETSLCSWTVLGFKVAWFVVERGVRAVEARVGDGVWCRRLALHFMPNDDMLVMG